MTDASWFDLGRPSEWAIGTCACQRWCGSVVKERDRVPDFAHIPVALCTATATADARRNALQNGFTESIPKPYDLDIFRDDLEAFLAVHCPTPAA